MLLLDDRHNPPRTKEIICPDCASFLQYSRLTRQEQQTRLADIRGGGSALVLRVAGKHLLAQPFGWFTVWGGPGSAKTLFLQALVAGYCQQGIRAVYYHAADLQTALLTDIHDDDSDHLGACKRVPVLAIDELDKYHWKEWSKKQMQALLDWRYRNMTTQVTLIASNRAPDEVDLPPDHARSAASQPWLPEDILSRMNDGRFHRLWPSALTPPPDLPGDEEHGYYVPGVYYADAPDMRPHLRKKEEQP